MTKKIDNTKEGTMIIIKNIRSLTIAAAVVAASLTSPFALAADPAAVAHVDALVSVMKDVGKAVEPSVVNIEVAKQAKGGLSFNGQPFDNDMLKRLFPDNDNDGEPDLPPGMQLRPDGEERTQYGEGSGVILDATADKAYVLTNNHVAGDSDKITVTLSDGRKIEDVKVLGIDPLSDLAVLEIKAEGLTALKWGNSDSIDKGDIVLAFGSPFGYVGSMTQGIVSGKNRTTNPMGGVGLLGSGAYEYFIQTDCAINPGNSGGPLVNIHGELVGINTAIASKTGGFNGIGFAVPSNLARFVYDQLKENGKVTRGFLGVGIRTVTELPKTQLERLNLDKRKGVYVGEVKNDSPAAGKLEVNDVILSVNGETVTTREELRLKIAFAKPGSEVKLAVLRDGQEKVVPVSVGTFTDPTQTAGAKKSQPAAPSTTEMGATLGDASAARLKSAGLPVDAKGALVTGIKDGSVAQLQGLVVGDLITKVNDAGVSSAKEAIDAIKAGSLKDGISLSVTNKEGTKSVFLIEE